MPVRSVENQLSIWGVVTVLCAGLAFTIPGLNALTMAAALISLTLVVARLGYTRAILLAIPGMAANVSLGSLATGYQAGSGLFGFFILAVIVPSILMGRGARNLASSSRTVAYGLIPFGIMLTLFAGIYAQIMGDLPAVIDRLNTELRITIGGSPALQSLIDKAFPPAEGSLSRFLESYDKVLAGMLKVLPAILILGFAGLVLIAFSAAGLLAPRLGIIFPRLRPFYLWRASGWWLLATLTGLIPVVFLDDETWFYGGVNVLIVVGHVYFIVGLSIVESYFRRLYKPGPIRILFYGLMVFLGIFALSSAVLSYTGLIFLVFLIALGLSDSRLNYNRENVETND